MFSAGRDSLTVCWEWSLRRELWSCSSSCPKPFIPLSTGMTSPTWSNTNPHPFNNSPVTDVCDCNIIMQVPFSWFPPPPRLHYIAPNKCSSIRIVLIWGCQVSFEFLWGEFTPDLRVHPGDMRRKARMLGLEFSLGTFWDISQAQPQGQFEEMLVSSLSEILISSSFLACGENSLLL